MAAFCGPQAEPDWVFVPSSAEGKWGVVGGTDELIRTGFWTRNRDFTFWRTFRSKSFADTPQAKGSMSVVTDKRGNFRQGYFVLVLKHTTPATQIPNGKSQLAVVDAGHHFISPWYMHMDLPCRVSGQRPKIDFDRKWISEINQPDTDQQQLYTNLWLNRTLYTPKHHRIPPPYICQKIVGARGLKHLVPGVFPAQLDWRCAGLDIAGSGYLYEV